MLLEGTQARDRHDSQGEKLVWKGAHCTQLHSPLCQASPSPDTGCRPLSSLRQALQPLKGFSHLGQPAGRSSVADRPWPWAFKCPSPRTQTLLGQGQCEGGLIFLFCCSDIYWTGHLINCRGNSQSHTACSQCREQLEKQDAVSIEEQ